MLIKFFSVLFSSILVLSFLSCKEKTPFAHYINNKTLVDDSAMVVTAHPVASMIGRDILKKGGNAVDAAIAVQFALAVCYPVAGNIGGGGFMVYRDKNGKVATLDFREMAPAASTKDMYLDKEGNPIEGKSQFGHLACGVPGSVAGMYEAFQKYSKLKDWKALVQPAIDAARFGVAITEKEATSFNEDDSIFTNVNGRKTVFNESAWRKDDVLVQDELAKTLTLIRDLGRDGFYTGETANLIVAEMKSGGGLITLQDLMNYKVVWREPITFQYRGYTIHSMPPPSSGGIALQQLLKSIEPYDIRSMKVHTPESVHLMVEAERRVYADRATHLGDPDYYKVPQKNLIDSLYIARRMATFQKLKSSKSSDIHAGNFYESEQTTHFSIVDQEGNAVSITTTLNGGYGSYVVVDGAGFIMNNEMDDFSVKPGVANLYGLIGAEANKIEAGKRMLSSMTPTIVEKDGNLKMVVGTPGGSTIITSVFQTIVNVIDFGMTATEAVNAPRFHHQWLPDAIQNEENCLSLETRSKLENMGHTFKSRKSIGRVDAILVNDKKQLEGAADHRGDDDAKGF
jgi:gamma-glutamyltranspeptidase / glutathione hydrolase